MSWRTWVESVAMLFRAIGINAEPFFQSWLLPCCAAGVVVIASWLVEAKQSVIENMAPVLTRLFTPLFAAPRSRFRRGDTLAMRT